MALQYLLLKSDTETDLTVQMNTETASGYNVVGGASCAISLDTLGNANELYCVLMARKTS